MQNKITVLHFTSIINKSDFIDTILKFSDSSKFRMLACTLTDESNIEDPEFQKAGILHYNLGVGHNSKYYPKIVKKLASILKKEKVDIIHTHHYHEALMGTLAAKFAGNVKVVIGRHYHEELYLTTTGFKLKMYLAIENFVNQNANAIISPSTVITELLKKQSVNANKIFNVTYGFDFKAPRYRNYSQEEINSSLEEFNIKDRFIIGNFGRHHPIKGQRYLIEAFAKFNSDFPDSKLLMVGDGPIHSELVGLVKKMALEDSVIFTGWRKDGHKLMAASDIVVHPTLQEAFPQTMIEVMSLGKPLIICPVSGASDQVKHKQTGYLVPFKNSESIYESLVWFRKNPSIMAEIGINAQADVFNRLDIRNVISDYENVYFSVL